MKPKKLSLQESLFFYLCSDKLWGLLTVGEDERYNGGEFKEVILMVSKALLERIKSEIEGDKRTYLENCVNNYSEYVEAAQTLFAGYYESMLRSLDEKKDAYTLYISKALECKDKGDMDRERRYLESAVENEADTPYAYERLAIVYSKEKKYQEAYGICRKWFDSIYWKIPNMASTTLKILDRMEKLESRLGK